MKMYVLSNEELVIGVYSHLEILLKAAQFYCENNQIDAGIDDINEFFDIMEKDGYYKAVAKTGITNEDGTTEISIEAFTVDNIDNSGM